MIKRLPIFLLLATSFPILLGNEALAAQEKGHEAAGGPGLPQLDPTWYASQIFWLVVTFVILYAIFSRNILPTLSSIIEDRRTRIQDDLDIAYKTKEESEAIHLSYEKALQDARESASAIFSETEESIRTQTEEELKKFRDISLTRIKDSEQRILESKKKALTDMESIAADLAAQAAEKVVGLSVNTKQAQDIVQNLNRKKAA